MSRYIFYLFTFPHTYYTLFSQIMLFITLRALIFAQRPGTNEKKRKKITLPKNSALLKIFQETARATHLGRRRKCINYKTKM